MKLLHTSQPWILENQNVGKVLLFGQFVILQNVYTIFSAYFFKGSEDLCIEQLQVIQEENIEEDQLSEKTKCKYVLRYTTIKEAFAQL